MTTLSLKQETPAKLAEKPNTSLAAKLSAFLNQTRELRRRLLWVVLTFSLSSALAYSFREQLAQVVMHSLEGQGLTEVVTSADFGFQITFCAGLLAASPMAMYQLYALVHSALPRAPRRLAAGVVSIAIGLMLIGVSYGYLIAVPAALGFLATGGGADVAPSLRADSYVSLFLSYVAGLGLLFQLPLLLIFWHWIKPLTPSGLLKSEQFVIFFAFVAAALLTPTPDIMNQAVIAAVLILIYQGGVAAILVTIKRAGAPTAPVRVRTIDGFVANPTIPHSARLPANRPLRVPPPRPASPLTRRQPLASIDGILRR